MTNKILLIATMGIIASSLWVGCSGGQKKPEVKEAVAPTLPPAAEPSRPITAPSEQVKSELTKLSDLTKKAEETAKIEQAAQHQEAQANHHKPEGTDPDKALGWLKNGNTRFVKNRLRKDGQSRFDITRLAKGQQPHSIILSCSDSRVPPELIFDQKLGEIFVIRTAGQTLDANALGSIEYAIEHLGSRNIVVMGHTKCGAVKAALGTLSGGDAGSPNLNHLVSDIHPRIRSFSASQPSQSLELESWANVRGVAEDLTERSSIIGNAVKTGHIKIRKGLYNLGSGSVDFQ